MADYSGFAILDVTEPDRGDGTPDGFDRKIYELATRTGTRISETPGPADRGVRDFVWLAFTRAEALALRTFINGRLGRAGAFWLQTWERDLRLSADQGPNSESLTVLECGYSTVFAIGAQRRHLAIRAPGGAFNYRKVTASVDNLNGTETLTLDSIISEALPVDSLITFMRFSRFDADEFELLWSGGHFARAALPVRELPNETPA